MVKPMVQKSQAAANVDNPIHIMPRSYLSTESNKTGSWRYLRPRYEEKTAPCSAACPAGEDIGKIEMLTAQGLFKEAWETILRENPFPGVCGRVCFHPCESVCNRGEFDDPIAIHSRGAVPRRHGGAQRSQTASGTAPFAPGKSGRRRGGAVRSGGCVVSLATGLFLRRVRGGTGSRGDPSLGNPPLSPSAARPAEGDRPDRGTGCPDPHGKARHDRSSGRFKVGIPGRLPRLRAWADNGVACPRRVACRREGRARIPRQDSKRRDARLSGNLRRHRRRQHGRRRGPEHRPPRRQGRDPLSTPASGYACLRGRGADGPRGGSRAGGTRGPREDRIRERPLPRHLAKDEGCRRGRCPRPRRTGRG